MIDLDTGEKIPTDLDCDFALTIWVKCDDGGYPEFLIDEGTPIGVHEIEHEGKRYRVVCSVEECSE